MGVVQSQDRGMSHDTDRVAASQVGPEKRRQKQIPWVEALRCENALEIVKALQFSRHLFFFSF